MISGALQQVFDGGIAGIQSRQDRDPLPRWHRRSRATCHDEIVIAFSCERRGLCPSCTARRMADTAAHLVGHVLPRAPYRQWAVSVHNVPTRRAVQSMLPPRDRRVDERTWARRVVAKTCGGVACHERNARRSQGDAAVSAGGDQGSQIPLPPPRSANTGVVERSLLMTMVHVSA